MNVLWLVLSASIRDLHVCQVYIYKAPLHNSEVVLYTLLLCLQTAFFVSVALVQTNYTIRVTGSPFLQSHMYAVMHISDLTLHACCREAQSEFAFRTRKGTYSSNYKGEHYIGQITCTGDEMSMSDCTVLVTSVKSCSNGHTIVDCTSGQLVPE